MSESVDVAIIGAGQAGWMRKNKSAILHGVGEDAEIVAQQIVARVR